jgi:hypothetical protein
MSNASEETSNACAADTQRVDGGSRLWPAGICAEGGTWIS